MGQQQSSVGTEKGFVLRKVKTTKPLKPLAVKPLLMNGRPLVPIQKAPQQVVGLPPAWQRPALPPAPVAVAPAPMPTVVATPAPMPTVVATPAPMPTVVAAPAPMPTVVAAPAAVRPTVSSASPVILSQPAGQPICINPEDYSNGKPVIILVNPPPPPVEEPVAVPNPIQIIMPKGYESDNVRLHYNDTPYTPEFDDQFQVGLVSIAPQGGCGYQY